MANEKIVKTLQFPSGDYQINAVALGGIEAKEYALKDDIPEKAKEAETAKEAITAETALKVQSPLKVGEQYYDGSAEVTITAADLGLTGSMLFLGRTTSELSDGSTMSPVIVNSNSVTPKSGDVVLYSNREYVWDGTQWEELGQEGSFKVQQTPVTSPVQTDGESITFVDNIGQDANGNITYTTKKVSVSSLNLTTDDIDGGTETWYFDCGTAFTVIS